MSKGTKVNCRGHSWETERSSICLELQVGWGPMGLKAWEPEDMGSLVFTLKATGSHWQLSGRGVACISGRLADSILKLNGMIDDLGLELKPLKVPAAREASGFQAPDGIAANYLPLAFDRDKGDRLKGCICDI